MLTPLQAKINDLLAEIDRLTPLAAAEHLATVAGIHIEDAWAGSGEAITRAQAERDRLVEQRKADVFADEVAGHRDLIEHREACVADLARIDAKISTFSDDERHFFAKADAITKWTARAAGTMPYASFPTSDMQRDAFGNILDVSPRDELRKPIVPDDKWEAVKQLRELYKERATVGQSLVSIDTGLRDSIAKSPALAFVKPRRLGAVA